MQSPQEKSLKPSSARTQTSAVASQSDDLGLEHVIATNAGKGREPSPTAESDSRSGSSSHEEPRESRQKLSTRVNFWGTIITALTAIAALILSTVTWYQLHSRPEMLVTMPKTVGWSAGDSITWMALQPTFTVSSKTDVTAVVSDVELDLARPDGQEVNFFWTQNVSFEPAEDGDYWVSKWASDPAPFTVAPDGPQAPYFFFTSHDLGKNLITSGAWGATLTVRRLEQAPLVVRFCMNLDDARVGSLQGPKSTGWWWVRREGGFITTQSVVHDPQCYEDADPIDTSQIAEPANTE